MNPYNELDDKIKAQTKIFKALEEEASKDPEAVIKKLLKVNLDAVAQNANNTYRVGTPVMSDWFYDSMVLEALKRQNPDSEFLRGIEPEPENTFGAMVELPVRMLSTDKAYSVDEIRTFAERVLEVGRQEGLAREQVLFRVTPKLDGFAACVDRKNVYTRGNGRQGQDISHIYKRGLVESSSHLAPQKGEIVVNKYYFEEHLSSKYENSRNVIAAAIKEGEPDPEITDAILTGNLKFVAFEDLASWTLDADELVRTLMDMWSINIGITKYDTDGLVIEAIDPAIKSKMGHTNHHYRWQIAFKQNTEFFNVRVTGITPQTSKSGRLTPVVELEPTKISGVTISRATGHHYRNIIEKGISTGALVKVCRSGLVIPYIADVIEPQEWVETPSCCPSCGGPVKKEGDHFLCANMISCPAQVGGKIEYFFKTLGNCDGFGPKIIDQLVKQGYSSISSIYKMDQRDFEACGLGSGIASNLCKELIRSQTDQIEDWRFLAAFGISNVGKGGCEKILRCYTLDEVFDCTIDDIMAINGFAERTARVFVQTLSAIKSEFDFLYREGFNLKQTKSTQVITSPIAGKIVVFTGSMQTGKRADMEAQAKELGATVSGSVSSKTDFLICGANVGESKTSAAKKNGTKVLLESEYLELIKEAA